MMTYSPPRSRAARATRSYAHVGLQTEVMGASPERLISLLLRGALAAMRQARHHLKNGDIQAKGAAVSKAIDIVESGLKASVDPTQGDVAQSLVASYDLVVRELMLANLHNSEEHLDAAEQSLGAIAQAWQSAIDPQFTGMGIPAGIAQEA